jgi:hypothetical protein
VSASVHDITHFIAVTVYCMLSAVAIVFVVVVILFTVCSVPYIVCVVLCDVFCLSVVCYFV